MSETSLIADVMSLERKLGLIRITPYNSSDLVRARSEWLAHLDRIRHRPDARGSQLMLKVSALEQLFTEYVDLIDQQIQANSQDVA